MERYACGDDAAFGAVYDELAPRLLAFLQRRLASAALAEDLLQQTFLRMHRARGSFVEGSAVLPWAFAIARRLLVDELRQRKRRELGPWQLMAAELLYPARLDGAHARLEADELSRRLQQAIHALPETQRAAFELIRLDGLSHAEAAQALGMTVTAVKLRAHRAGLALRAALDGK
jgi:RNA polymerase sigma-70 factor (ECF subfamily)